MKPVHNIKCLLILIGICIVANQRLSSQDLYTPNPENGHSYNFDFENYDARDGLTSNVAYAIIEDKRGFIWIGTQDGLNRFDGYNFKIYGAGPEGGKYISHSGIKTIFEDSQGYIWIGTEGGGLNCYDPETEMFWHFFHEPNDQSSLSSNHITAIAEDKQNVLWIGTSEGLNQMLIERDPDPKEQYGKPFTCRFRRFSSHKFDPSSISDNRVSCLMVDDYDNLWIGTSTNGINVFKKDERDKDEGAMVQITTEKRFGISLTNNSVNSIFEDQWGAIWVATARGITRLSKRDPDGFPSKSRHILIAPEQVSNVGANVVFDLEQDLMGNLWIATMGGGLSVVSNPLLNEESGLVFYSFLRNDLNPEGISANAINSLAITKSGDLWFATHNRGIGQVKTRGEKFHTYRNNPNNPNSLSNNVVKTIIEDRSENLWIGTWGGGLTKYSPSSSQFKTYIPDQNRRNWLGSDIIQVIIEDKTGMLWIGTQGMGLYQFNPETDEFIKKPWSTAPGSQIFSDDIWSMYPGRSGEIIWIGTYEGLIMYDITTGQVTHFVNDPENEQSISFNEIRSLYEDSEENLWIGTGGGGLDRLDLKTRKFHHYRHDPTDSASLSNNSIYSIFEDRSGNLWIGTLGGGLNMISQNHKYAENPSFNLYRKNEGLANDVVKGILEDDNGNLWISTTNGLSKLNIATNSFVNYSESDGLQSNIFNLGACFKTSNGELIFGGVKGFTMFSPDEITEDTIPPSVILTDLKISNNSVAVGEKLSKKVVLQKSISRTEEIELSHKLKVISFEFSSLVFTNQEKIKYAYRLVGLHEQWIETDFRGRSTTYSNLKPGKYEFQVIASRSTGSFTYRDPTSISMHIRPAIYKTNVALFLYISLILLGFIYARRIARNRMRLKMEIEKERTEYQRRMEVDQMKLRFFTNISHEFRTPLALLYGPLQKLVQNPSPEDSQKQIGIMEKSVTRMLRLVNQLLDFRKMEHGALDFMAIEGNMAMTIKDVISMFEEVASQKGIRYQFTITEEKLVTWYDPDKIEKILINLLSNAFKFTSPGDDISVKVNKVNSGTHSVLAELIAREDVAGRPEDYIVISVSDSGKGISEKDLGLIFERFYRVEDSDQPDQGGTGIGLAMVKKLVEMHHGEIRVESFLSKGSTFSVFIPFGKEYLSPNEVDEAARHPSAKKLPSLQDTVIVEDESPLNETDPALNKDADPVRKAQLPLLLIVEDDFDLLDFLKDSLKAKYRIHTAGDGSQALKSIITNHPEVVISDIMMPVMDGVELVREIKSDIRISHIPVILLTSKSALEHRLEGLESGADAYISKPFHLDALTAQIENLLNSRKLLRKKILSEVNIQPEKITVKSIDQKYLEKAIYVVETFIADDTFTVEQFAKEMFESRVQLYRKLKGLTGLSPNEFVRNIRIKRAAEILVQEGITVGEVMYKVGFSNRSYFNRSFRQVFDTSPVKYQQSQRV